MKANRNDACPCGSGKKFKKCCEGKSSLAGSGIAKRSGIIGAISILVAAGAVAAWLNRSDVVEQPEPAFQTSLAVAGAAPSAAQSAEAGSPSVPARAAGSTFPAAQPPGAAPVGKIWSAEHGHWHDAPNVRTPTSGTNPIQVTTSTAPLVPGSNVNPPMAFSQPTTPAPPGKVWSAAHGHWHDAPAGAMANPIRTAPQTRNVPQPPGPVPPGKVWSPQHGHWHDRQ